MVKQLPDNNLQFLRDKVYSLRTALMYTMSNSLVKVPNNIVTALRIDDEGYLWFTCTACAQHLNEYESSFPARLHFFKKGVGYYMELSGKACIIKNYESDENRQDDDPSLLIKMNILNAEYVEPATKRKTKLDAWIEQACAWMLRNIAIPYSSKSVFSKLQQTNNI